MLLLKLFTLLFIIDAERINSLCMWKGDCFCAWKGDCLCKWKGDCLCWSWGDQWLMQRINSQLSHEKFKRFNLFLLHVGIKTVYITVYNWHREDQQSLSHGKFKRFNSACEKVIKTLYMKRQIDAERINSLCMWKGDHLYDMKRWSPLHMKRQSSWLILGGWWWCREDQQSTFTWKIQKI